MILLVSGSGSGPEGRPYAPLRPSFEGERCATGFKVLQNPHADRLTKQAILDGMRSAGCLGVPQQLLRRRQQRRPPDDEP